MRTLKRSRQRGFTLVEVVIVFLIALTLVGLGAWAIKSHRGYDVQGSGRELGMFFTTLRNEAINRLSRIGVIISGEAGAWDKLEAYVDSNNNHQLDEGEKIIKQLTFPKGIYISKIVAVYTNGVKEEVDEDVFSDLEFNPMGLPELAGKRFESLLIVISSSTGREKPFMVELSSGVKISYHTPIEDTNLGSGSGSGSGIGSGSGQDSSNDDNSNDRDKCFIIEVPIGGHHHHHHNHHNHHHHHHHHIGGEFRFEICPFVKIKVRKKISLPIELPEISEK